MSGCGEAGPQTQRKTQNANAGPEAGMGGRYGIAERRAPQDGARTPRELYRSFPGAPQRSAAPWRRPRETLGSAEAEAPPAAKRGPVAPCRSAALRKLRAPPASARLARAGAQRARCALLGCRGRCSPPATSALARPRTSLRYSQNRRRWSKCTTPCRCRRQIGAASTTFLRHCRR